MHKKLWNTGFSLLEVVMVLFIGGIIFSITLSSHRSFLFGSTVDIIRLQLLNAIHLTRHEAMIRREIVTLCQSADQKTCSGDWGKGNIILSKNKVIYAFPNVLNPGQLYWRAFPKGQSQVRYLPTGTLQIENGTFWYCLPGEKTPRWEIILSQSGRVREVFPHAQYVATIANVKTNALSCLGSRAD